jgi:uncharacterized membrane protein
MSPRVGLAQQPQFYFALALAVSVIAFWPQLFSQLATIDAAHLLHGLTATAWMAIPVIQAWLATNRHFAAHRYLGRVWLLVAPVVLISGLHMIQLMILEYIHTHEAYLLKFAFLDFAGIVFFVAFLVLAVKSIRKGQVGTHARYMACTMLIALEPAIERVFRFYVPGFDGFEEVLYPALITMEVTVVGLLIADWRRGKPISPAYVAALALFVTVHTFATPVADSSAFQHFATWFALL